MQIRAYRPEDCTELAELFYHTVHTVNAKDYTAQELEAWACGTVDLEAWNSSFLAHTTLVAEADGRLVGFGDMDASGYLDRLYIHADYQGRALPLQYATVWNPLLPPNAFAHRPLLRPGRFLKNAGIACGGHNRWSAEVSF